MRSNVFRGEDLDQAWMNNFDPVSVESFVMEVLVEKKLCLPGTHIEL